MVLSMFNINWVYQNSVKMISKSYFSTRVVYNV